MGFESIIKPIESKDKRIHEQQVQERILLAQILFSVKQYEKIDEKTKPLFSQFIFEETDILKKLKLLFSNDNGLDIEDEKVKEYERKIKEEVNEITEGKEGDSLIDPVSAYITNEYSKFKGLLWEQLESLGLIRFREVSGYSMEMAGFSKDDDFLRIHFSGAYQLEDIKIGLEEVKKEFSNLAEIIIDRYPQTRAIVGVSWLLDTPIARQFGFKVIDEKKESQNTTPAWMQLVDKNGQIDKEKFNQALETGHLPYKNSFGYISTEEFLQRYLPDNRRGEITLKVIDADKLKEIKKEPEGENIKYEKPYIEKKVEIK